MLFPIKPKSMQDLYDIFGNPSIYQDEYGVYHVSNKWESENLVLITTPLSLPKRVYCHKIFAPILSNIFTEISDRGLDHLIYTWDGCFNVRTIKRPDGVSSGIMSSHTFAISVDCNAPYNKRGIKWEHNLSPKRQDEKLIKIFKDNGCCFGNDFRIPDPMHFSLVYW